MLLLMRKKRRTTAFLAGLAAFYALVFGGRALWTEHVRSVRLETSRDGFYHDQFIEIVLNTRDPVLNARWALNPPRVAVTRGGAVVETIAGIRELPFVPSRGGFSAKWPCPWNAPEGTYELELRDSGIDDADRIRKRSFRILRRKPKPIPNGYAVLTMESVDSFRNMRVKTPSGEVKDWKGMFDWVEYIGADAFWVLGSRTPGFRKGEVWVRENLDMIPALAKEAKRRNLRFGVYLMCYLTLSEEQVGGYEYALEVRDGKPVPTRAISIRERKRLDDVAALLKRFHDIPGVDEVGLDYIRNPLGGYELAEDFFAGMPGVSPPPEWPRLSKDERMAWFARKKIARKDRAFIDAWQWWRAHKVAQIVREIRARLGGDEGKPLWAFTLTWDKGWHHGQDPVMINDAGVDYDALMLYEADREQFDFMVKEWGRYMKRADAQLLVGDAVDWPLHQRDPSGPGEFGRRTLAASEAVYSDGPAAGVFVHDLSRALWGRTGPWGTLPWMEEARKVIKQFKARSAAAGAAGLAAGAR